MKSQQKPIAVLLSILMTLMLPAFSVSAAETAGGSLILGDADDGINAAGGQDQSSQGGRPGQNPFRPSSSSNNSITINGGEVYVVSSGDGVDSNGALNFNGGIVVVQGPNSGGNFAVDADGTVGFNGGTGGTVSGGTSYSSSTSSGGGPGSGGSQPGGPGGRW